MPFDERRPLSIRAWLAIPVLFATAVLGLTGLGAILLDADWHVPLSSALFAPTAAITALLSAGVDWPSARLRWWIGFGYPALVLGAGLLLAGISVPPPVATAIGAPALITLAVLLAREHNRIIPIA